MENCWKFCCQRRIHFTDNIEMLAFGLWRWCIFLIFILCTDVVVWNFSDCLQWSLLMKIYWHGRVKITNFLHRLLGFEPTIILTIFFCKVIIFWLLGELPPQNYPMYYYKMKIDITNSYCVMCCALLESFDQYDSSNLGGYQL